MVLHLFGILSAQFALKDSSDRLVATTAIGFRCLTSGRLNVKSIILIRHAGAYLPDIIVFLLFFFKVDMFRHKISNLVSPETGRILSQ
jgi:hypothetical protein